MNFNKDKNAIKKENDEGHVQNNDTRQDGCLT